MTTPRPYPDGLHKAHENFTDKSRAGYPIRVYDYIEGQMRPIMGALKPGAGKAWISLSWDNNDWIDEQMRKEGYDI